MRAPFVRVFSVLSLAAILGATVAYGQEPLLTVRIDFSFNVPGKVLPAGDYTVSSDSSNQKTLVIRGVPPNNESAMVASVTRLSQAGSSNAPRLVFDRVGDQSYLSEVWFPDKDGYLLTATSERHTHAIVKASKK